MIVACVPQSAAESDSVAINVALIVLVPGRAAAGKTKQNAAKVGPPASATWAEKRRAEQDSKEWKRSTPCAAVARESMKPWIGPLE